MELLKEGKMINVGEYWSNYIDRFLALFSEINSKIKLLEEHGWIDHRKVVMTRTNKSRFFTSSARYIEAFESVRKWGLLKRSVESNIVDRTRAYIKMMNCFSKKNLDTQSREADPRSLINRAKDIFDLSVECVAILDQDLVYPETANVVALLGETVDEYIVSCLIYRDFLNGLINDNATDQSQLSIIHQENYGFDDYLSQLDLYGISFDVSDKEVWLTEEEIRERKEAERRAEEEAAHQKAEAESKARMEAIRASEQEADERAFASHRERVSELIAIFKATNMSYSKEKELKESFINSEYTKDWASNDEYVTFCKFFRCVTFLAAILGVSPDEPDDVIIKAVAGLFEGDNDVSISGQDLARMYPAKGSDHVRALHEMSKEYLGMLRSGDFGVCINLMMSVDGDTYRIFITSKL